jgi:hypothetical protein
VNFEIGYQVLAHLRNEIFPRGKYNKLKMKKKGPCKILRKFSTNAYEIELPEDIRISPIFNVANLYPYKMDGTEGTDDQEEIHWKQQIPIAEKLQIQNILDHRIAKKTRRNIYYDYLVKWENHLAEYVCWITEIDI